jgi:hypothetical protein
MLMLASSSSSPRHRGSIERGVDGGDHRVIGGLATEMYSDRLQEMIALSDRATTISNSLVNRLDGVPFDLTPSCAAPRKM